jgi:hypothetical protein
MPETKLPAPGVGELTALLPSCRLHLEAANLSPRTIRVYTDDGALPAAFLATKGMSAVLRIRREHCRIVLPGVLKVCLSRQGWTPQGHCAP